MQAVQIMIKSEIQIDLAGKNDYAEDLFIIAKISVEDLLGIVPGIIPIQRMQRRNANEGKDSH
jgi:hypothetical protein